MRPMRAIAFALAALVLAMPCRISAADSGGQESLGNKLLDDLNAVPPQQPADAPAPQNPAAGPQGANTPLNSQPAQPKSTEPIASAMIPLARVQQGMQQVQTILAQPGIDTHAGTVELANSVQQEVVSELDKLIAELSKQCQSCNGGQCKPNAGDKPGKPKPGGKPGSATARSQSPARDSNDRLDRTSAQPVDKGDVTDVVKQLWGHLPERSRAEMLQSFSDEFLPKYQQEIEQYYRRLSEEGATSENRPPSD